MWLRIGDAKTNLNGHRYSPAILEALCRKMHGLLVHLDPPPPGEAPHEGRLANLVGVVREARFDAAHVLSADVQFFTGKQPSGRFLTIALTGKMGPGRHLELPVDPKFLFTTKRSAFRCAERIP